MNIIFDLGGVVFEWRPDKLIEQVFSDPADRKLVAADLLSNPDWAELDRGALDKDLAVDRASKRSGISGEKIRRLLDLVPGSLTPREDTIALISRLKEAGNRLFVLSNMHHDSADYLQQTYPIWDHFEGVVFSCRVKMVKPDPGIFEYIRDIYRLEGDETVFIDDTKVNTETAMTIGMRTVHFQSSEQCEAELKAMGCL